MKDKEGKLKSEYEHKEEELRQLKDNYINKMALKSTLQKKNS